MRSEAFHTKAAQHHVAVLSDGIPGRNLGQSAVCPEFRVLSLGIDFKEGKQIAFEMAESGNILIMGGVIIDAE